MTKNWHRLTAWKKKKKIFKNAIFLSKGLKGRPSHRGGLKPSKKNTKRFKPWNFLTFSNIAGQSCSSGSGSESIWIRRSGFKSGSENSNWNSEGSVKVHICGGSRDDVSWPPAPPVQAGTALDATPHDQLVHASQPVRLWVPEGSLGRQTYRQLHTFTRYKVFFYIHFCENDSVSCLVHGNYV